MCRRGESYVGWILFLSIGRPLGSISSSLPNMRTYISPFTCVKNTGSEPGCSPFKSRLLYPRACPFVKLTSLLCTVFSLGVTGVMSACIGAIRGPELMYAQCLQEEPSPQQGLYLVFILFYIIFNIISSLQLLLPNI